MKATEKPLRFLLGANTPQGFVSRFDQMIDVDGGWRTFVIKGGPGSGKSTMMKRIAEAFRHHKDLELIYCSSDVDSLDGVIIPGLKVSILDGTSPHVIEPKYPGAVESLVNISACWDDAELFAHRDEIVRLSTACSRRHEHCCRFLNAASALMGDTYRIALDCTNTQKLSAYCNRLAERELKPKKDAGSGREYIRLLSAVTNKGVVTFTDSVKKLCERIFLITDDYGAVSRLLMHTMRSKALAAGYDVITSYCPLSPFDKIEHLIIPELNIGFMTSNRVHDFSLLIDPYRIINAKRFLDNDALKQSKKRISFNRRAEAQMIAQAEQLLQECKSLHDELERYYIDATDFDKVELLTQEVIAKFQAIEAGK